MVSYRPRTIRARKPRLIARARVALLNRARAGAALYSLSLHRSPWQHCVTQEPLLIWPCWLLLEVHESTQSFFTRFPVRVSTAHRRGKGIRPGLPCTLAPTEHPTFPTTTITMTDPSLVSCLGLLSWPWRVLRPRLTCGNSFAILGAGWAGLRLFTVGAAAAHMTPECTGWRMKGQRVSQVKAFAMTESSVICHLNSCPEPHKAYVLCLAQRVSGYHPLEP